MDQGREAPAAAQEKLKPDEFEVRHEENKTDLSGSVGGRGNPADSHGNRDAHIRQREGLARLVKGDRDEESQTSGSDVAPMVDRAQDGDGISGDDLCAGVPGGMANGKSADRVVAEYSANSAECVEKPAPLHSVSPISRRKVDQSAEPQTEYSAMSEAEYSVWDPPCNPAGGQLYDFAEFRAKLSTQHSAVFDNKIWKRSREKPGYLIKRIKGYNPVEDKYGVQYLYVLSRKPDRTSGDYSVYPFAGFFNWDALANTGLFVKERKSNAKRQQK